MTTFSQAIDALVAESRRKDVQSNIETYLNHTIREVHAASDGNPIKYAENLVEEIAYAEADDRATWSIPTPQRFQLMEAVWYPWIERYARLRTPGTTMQFEDAINADLLYYRTGPSFAFGGFGGKDAPIWLAYFLFPRRLQYYKPELRPATWDELTESFTYLTAYDVDDDTRENARNLSTNWLLDRHEDSMMQGARAKLYARLADDVRMRQAYSAYETARVAIASTETYNGGPFFAR